MPVYNAQGEQVVLGREVGSGQRADVFLVRNRPDLVAKLYRDPLGAEEERKVRALVGLHTPELGAVAVWPMNTVHDHAQRPVGLLRPFLNLGDYRPLPHLYSPALRMKAFPRADWAFRAHVAARVAQAFAALHTEGQVMGDVSAGHVLVSSLGQVRLVNVEAYQVRQGEDVYTVPTVSAEFLPPELQEQDLSGVVRTENHDLFGLAVLVFYLLFDGHHPYAGLPEKGEMPSPARAIARHAFAYARPPVGGVRQPPETLPLSALPRPLQALFEQAFAPAEPHRPGAQEWAALLGAFADTLVVCTRNPEHQHERGQRCPWCELSAIRQVSPFVAALNPSDAPDMTEQLQNLWQQVIHVPAPLRSPVIPEAEVDALPRLELELPPRPNLVSEAQSRRVLSWVLRAGVLVVIMAVTIAVQRSVIAGLIVPALIILAFTVGRRVSVDWDGLIDSYQRWEDGLTSRLLPGRSRWQAYQAALQGKRDELSGQLNALLKSREELEERYSKENAHAEYQRDFAALEEQRRALLQGQERQEHAVESLLLQRRTRAIADYLRRQPIRAHILPHFTSQHELQLANQGVRTAYDLGPEKLPAIPEYWHDALLLWRQGLEDFLPVSADLVSTQEIQALRQQHDEHLREQLQDFIRAVTRFKNAAWGQHQQDIVMQMAHNQAQARQLRHALNTLDELARTAPERRSTC